MVFYKVNVLFPWVSVRSKATCTFLSSMPIEINLSSMRRYSPRKPPSTPSPAKIGHITNAMPWMTEHQGTHSKNESQNKSTKNLNGQDAVVFIHSEHLNDRLGSLVNVRNCQPSKFGKNKECQVVHLR